MTRRHAPPRLATRLLESRLPRDILEPIAGDLEEGYVERLTAVGRARAALWYWREAIGFVLAGDGVAHGHTASRASGSRKRGADETRSEWGRPAIEAFGRDIRFGARLLARSRVFTLFAVVSLALGIGAATATFTLFDAIVLKSLPVHEPDRLVVLSYGTDRGHYHAYLPYPQFARMRDGNRTLAGLFAIAGPGRVAVAVNEQASLASRLYATGGYYAVLGLRPALGRLLTEDDDRPGNAVVVISHAYWQSRFGGSAAVIGSGIRINQVPFTIVGVEPRGFRGTSVGATNDVTIPMRTLEMLSTQAPPWDQANDTWIHVLGRLRPGVSREQAEQDLGPLFMQASLDAARTAPIQYRADAERGAREARVFVDPGAGGVESALRYGYGKWLRLMMALVGTVMLLAGLNVATLLLSRSRSRRREIATRLALGAGRWRVVQQLLTESALLAAMAGVLGAGLAWWASIALLRVAIPTAEQLPLDLTPDARVLGFAIAAAALTCMLFGLLPALRSTAVRAGSFDREIGVRRRRVVDRSLVASQVALSLVLAVCAGLFVRSLSNLWTQETGYDRGNVLMFSVDAGLAGMKGDEARTAYWRLLEELKSLPAVQLATASSVRPVDGNSYFVDVVTRIGTRDFRDRDAIPVAHNHLAPGYFSTMGVPIILGREFTARDDIRAARVAIISETMARRRFPDQNPVGQLMTMGESDTREIIGVARDVRYGNVRNSPGEVVYRSMLQATGEDFWFTPSFEIRYAGTEEQMRGLVRATVDRVDPALAVFRMKTLEVETQESLTRERLLATLTTYFGAFAMLLACIGLYGLMSYVVTQRTPEIGLRMALGAHRAGVQWLLLRESAVTVVAGLTVGICAALATARVVRAQLFGIEPTDPLTLAGATLLLSALAAVAAYLPASRASRIDPAAALRS